MKNEANSEPERLTIHLQGCGRIHAKRVADVVAGDVLVWNYGHRSEVLSIESTSACFVTLNLRGSDGTVSPRKLKLSRLVGWTPAGTQRIAAERKAKAAELYAIAYTEHVELCGKFVCSTPERYERLAELAGAAGFEHVAAMNLRIAQRLRDEVEEEQEMAAELVARAELEAQD